MKRPSTDTPSSKRSKLEVQQTLYLKNLNDKVNKGLLKHIIYVLFSTYGDVVAILMPPHLRGQAHVILDSKVLANSALRALQKTSIFGKELHIDYAKKKTHFVDELEKDAAL